MLWREMSVESQHKCLESKLDLDTQDVEVLYERIQETHAISKATGVLDIDCYNVRQAYHNLAMSDNEHLSAFVKRTYDCLKVFERVWPGAADRKVNIPDDQAQAINFLMKLSKVRYGSLIRELQHGTTIYS